MQREETIFLIGHRSLIGERESGGSNRGECACRGNLITKNLFRHIRISVIHHAADVTQGGIEPGESYCVGRSEA